MGNCSLMGSRSLTAMSRPLLAPCASSAAYLMVPKGPPVFVLTSKVPAECHLNHNHNNQSDRIRSDRIQSNIYMERGKRKIKGGRGRGIYAIRSMRGAQLFSAIKLLSFFLAFSTALLYSSLTVG